MDIGMIVIVVADGVAVVSRCEDSPDGERYVPAHNAMDLAARAAETLTGRGIDLTENGVHLCTDQLQAAAEFPPLRLPDDAAPFRYARETLYPTLSQNEAWPHIHEDMKVRRFLVYRTGIGQEIRTFVSRSEVDALASARASEAAVPGGR